MQKNRVIRAIVILTGLMLLVGLASMGVQSVPAGISAQEEANASQLQTRWDDGFEALITGQYRAARSAGRELADDAQWKAKGLWLQARTIMECDDPRKAVELLHGETEARATDQNLELEYGWALINTGRHAEAFTVAQGLLGRQLDDLRFQTLAAEALWLQGDQKNARPIFDAVMRDSASIKIAEGAQDDYWTAEALWAAGHSAYRINDLHLAQARWDVGRRAHRRHAACWTSLGQVFYETSKDASARQNYCEVVTGSISHDGFNPNYAGAWYITSLTHAFRWNGGAAAAAMARALRANRWYLPALAAQGAYLITQDQYDEGIRLLDRALEVNPNLIGALGGKALHAATLGMTAEFEALEARALAVNPMAAEFYEIVADGLSSRHRFVESVEFYRKGLELDSRRWTIHQSLGRALLNLGDHEAGEEHLKTAHRNDMLRNSIHTFNLLQLLGTYDQFRRFEMDDGRYSVLINQDEVEIVEPYYRRELERVTKRLTEKYDGYEPAKPVVIESFNRHRDFEVRTVGIEGLPALGACFGRLVTLDSPSAREPGTYNWASTLWHEMDHVWQLQMSNGQIPRWLAEGCSVYEEGANRPEWERHMEQQLFETWATDGLPKVKEFNTWFGDGSRVLFAYYLGSVMVDFIVKHYGGYNTVITMIREFAAKKTPDEVFEGTLKIDTEEFDKRFAEFVGNKVSRIKLLPPVSVEDLEDLQIKAEDGEASTAELIKLAQGCLQTGRFTDARLWSRMAEARGGDEPQLHYVLGMLARSDPQLSQSRRSELEKHHLTKALELGLQDFNVYMAMARFAQQDQDTEAMVRWLEAARDAFETNPAPLMPLFQHYQQANDEPKVREIAKRIALLDENNLMVRELLMDFYQKQGNWEQVADLAMQIIYVNPFAREPHRLRALALQELKQWDDAVFEWEMFRRTSNRSTSATERLNAAVDAAVGKAKVWHAAGEMAKAREELLNAEALDKENAKVEELRKLLSGE